MDELLYKAKSTKNSISKKKLFSYSFQIFKNKNNVEKSTLYNSYYLFKMLDYIFGLKYTVFFFYVLAVCRYYNMFHRTLGVTYFFQALYFLFRFYCHRKRLLTLRWVRWDHIGPINDIEMDGPRCSKCPNLTPVSSKRRVSSSILTSSIISM